MGSARRPAGHGRSRVLRLTLVNMGGPDTSPAYSDDTGLCIWSTGTFQSWGGWSCYRGIWVHGVQSYPRRGLRQRLDQGGAMRKGFGGLRRGRADGQGHRRGLFLNSTMQQRQKRCKLRNAARPHDMSKSKKMVFRAI